MYENQLRLMWLSLLILQICLSFILSHGFTEGHLGITATVFPLLAGYFLAGYFLVIFAF